MDFYHTGLYVRPVRADRSADWVTAAPARNARVRQVTDADVHLVAQPRLDTIVTEFHTDARQLRTDYVGVAWIGDEPDDESGMMGPDYHRRNVESRLFLPDTHWYDVAALEDVEVQVSAGLLQVPGTGRGTQGLVGALAEPVVEFYEHPEGESGVGLCLELRGEIWSNLGLSYRVTVLSRPEAVLRTGDVSDLPGGTSGFGDGDNDRGRGSDGTSDSGDFGGGSGGGE